MGILFVSLNLTLINKASFSFRNSHFCALSVRFTLRYSTLSWLYLVIVCLSKFKQLFIWNFAMLYVLSMFPSKEPNKALTDSGISLLNAKMAGLLALQRRQTSVCSRKRNLRYQKTRLAKSNTHELYPNISRSKRDNNSL